MAWEPFPASSLARTPLPVEFEGFPYLGQMCLARRAPKVAALLTRFVVGHEHSGADLVVSADHALHRGIVPGCVVHGVVELMHVLGEVLGAEPQLASFALSSYEQRWIGSLLATWIPMVALVAGVEGHGLASSGVVRPDTRERDGSRATSSEALIPLHGYVAACSTYQAATMQRPY